MDSSATGVISRIEDLWAPGCLLCSEYTKARAQCSYGQAVVWSSDRQVWECLPCLSRAYQEQHRVMVPTLLSNCSGNGESTMCDKGFYPDPDTPQRGACLPCQIIPVQCPNGFFPNRCLTTLEDGVMEGQCTPCSIPPIPNHSSHVYEYGPGFLFNDCTQTERVGAQPNLATCAYFQTPKWDRGYCTVYCRSGYVLDQAVSTRAAVDLPVCLRCATECAAGFYPPHCPGGLATTSGGGGSPGSCLPCDRDLLPNNAVWVNSTAALLSSSVPAIVMARAWCVWRCLDIGFYGNDDGECVACPSRFSYGPMQCNATAGERWMGCNGASSGSCVLCNASCPPSQYIQGEVYHDRCECVACRQPVAGQTYVAINCTSVGDAVLRPCSACVSSPNSSSKLGAAVFGAYRAAPCTRYADTRCVLCTPPRDMAGRRLVSSCTDEADAQYAPCPEGYACDGSPVPYQCSAPRVARGGFCVCPPATEEEGGRFASTRCVPVLCSNGTYPDASYYPTNNGCRNCSVQPDTPWLRRPPLSAAPSSQGAAAVFIRTRARIPGFDACACPSGYIRTVQYLYDGNANEIRPHIGCWPCGDLGCMHGIQRQTGCYGDTPIEPRCACGLGPGMEIVPLHARTVAEQTCAATCASGYFQTQLSIASLLPGLYDRYAFISLPAGARDLGVLAWPSSPSIDNGTSMNSGQFTTPSSFVGSYYQNNVDPDCPWLKRGVALNEDTLLVVCGGWEGQMLVVRTGTGAFARLDLSIFEIEGVRTSIRARDILAHRGSAQSGFVWLLFEFEGLCGDHLDDFVPTGPCFAFELLILSARGEGQGCAAGVCILQGSSLWGNAFPGRGIVGRLYAPTWAQGLHSTADPAAEGGAEGSLYFFCSDPSSSATIRFGRYVIVFYDASVRYSDRSADDIEWFAVSVPASFTETPLRLFAPEMVTSIAVAWDGVYVGTVFDPIEEQSLVRKYTFLWRMECLALSVAPVCRADAADFWNPSSTNSSGGDDHYYYHYRAKAIAELVALPVAGPDAYIVMIQTAFSSSLLSSHHYYYYDRNGKGSGSDDAHSGISFYTVDLLNRIVSYGLNDEILIGTAAALHTAGMNMIVGGGGGDDLHRHRTLWVTGFLRPMPSSSSFLIALNERVVWRRIRAQVCPPDTYTRYYYYGGNDGDNAVGDAGFVEDMLGDNIRSIAAVTAGQCTPAQCARAEPCGKFSRRDLGSVVCQCQPGYAWVDSSEIGTNAKRGGRCVPCMEAANAVVGLSEGLDKEESKNNNPSAFCVGGLNPPTQCQPNSVVAVPAASSRDDCLCLPGYFLYQETCLLCPTSLWCPFNGTNAPIQCHNNGFTRTDGSISPLSCVCPKRTYGIRCTPCTDRMECSTSVRAELSALFIDAWGPVWGYDNLQQCLLNAAEGGLSQDSSYREYYAHDMSQLYLIYPVLGVSRASLALAAQQSTSLLAWSWVVVLTDASQWLFRTEGAEANFTACMRLGFSRFSVQTDFTPATSARIVRPNFCGGRHWEWNGDTVNEECVCVAGFYEVDTLVYGRRCIPCPNGTFRARRSERQSCDPCLASRFEVGGYLGMEECACMRGYQRDNRTRECRLPVAGEGESGEPPEWYKRIASITHDQSILVLLSVGSAAAAFMFSLILVCAF